LCMCYVKLVNLQCNKEINFVIYVLACDEIDGLIVRYNRIP
jgi:hypothetical protein